MLNRIQAEASLDEAFTELDLYLLEKLVPDEPVPHPAALASYIVKLARLGGYPACAYDPPPGNIVIWRGRSRLTDVEREIMIGVQFVGN